MLRRAAAIQKKQPAQGSVDEAAGAISRGDAFLAAKSLASAKAQYFRAAALYEDALGPADPKVKSTLDRVALVYERQGKPQLAGYFRRRGVIQSEPAYKR